jgi:hypothetical protein
VKRKRRHLEYDDKPNVTTRSHTNKLSKEKEVVAKAEKGSKGKNDKSSKTTKKSAKDKATARHRRSRESSPERTTSNEKKHVASPKRKRFVCILLKM